MLRIQLRQKKKKKEMKIRRETRRELNTRYLFELN